MSLTEDLLFDQEGNKGYDQIRGRKPNLQIFPSTLFIYGFPCSNVIPTELKCIKI